VVALFLRGPLADTWRMLARAFLCIFAVTSLGLLAGGAEAAGTTRAGGETRTSPERQARCIGEAICARIRHSFQSGARVIGAPAGTTTGVGPIPMPCSGVTIRPGDDIQTIIDADPGGTIFCIGAGLYRLPAPLIAKSGDVFIGEVGSTLSGAKDISTLFAKQGAYYVASGQTQHGWVSGATCRTRTACRYPDDVFLDDKPLQHVLSMSALVKGAYYFDYANSAIYLYDNPFGHKVEASVTERAFKSYGLGIFNVTIANLTITQFQTPTDGAVQASKGWDIEHCRIRLNHRVGVRNGTTIRYNDLSDNGQLGFTTYGNAGVVFDHNEVARNNWAGFAPMWEAGGAKIMFSQEVTLSNNYVHDNLGIGLWTDTDNYQIAYSGNTIIHNGGPGIFHEASADAVILNNVVTGNGFDPVFAGWLDGSGILVNSSRNVEIFNNTLTNNSREIGITQTDRGTGPYGPRIVSNVYVHDNALTHSEPTTLVGGVVTAYTDPDLYEHRAHFESNRYSICKTATLAWNGYISASQWVAAGQDTTGTFNVIC
jgi:parallel beta-helix repeat protein